MGTAVSFMYETVLPYKCWISYRKHLLPLLHRQTTEPNLAQLIAANNDYLNYVKTLKQSDRFLIPIAASELPIELQMFKTKLCQLQADFMNRLAIAQETKSDMCSSDSNLSIADVLHWLFSLSVVIIDTEGKPDNIEQILDSIESGMRKKQSFL